MRRIAESYFGESGARESLFSFGNNGIDPVEPVSRKYAKRGIEERRADCQFFGSLFF